MACPRRNTHAQAEGKRLVWSPVPIHDCPAISISSLNGSVETSKECPRSVYPAGLAQAKQSSPDYLPVWIVHTTALFHYPVYRVFHLCARVYYLDLSDEEVENNVFVISVCVILSSEEIHLL